MKISPQVYYQREQKIVIHSFIKHFLGQSVVTSAYIKNSNYGQQLYIRRPYNLVFYISRINIIVLLKLNQRKSEKTNLPTNFIQIFLIILCCLIFINYSPSL